ncbi:MAG: PEP-CTERM sorting domain-containing protein [Sphingobium sp.]|nr:PEP-CTERM sorting domain-containing protein [Sphingobium sp.]
MKTKILLAASALAIAVPAYSGTVYSNNFDSENGGNSQLNYTGFTGLTVTDGTVDLVKTPGFGIICAGGAGSCVDLDGSTSDAGVLNSASSYAFTAGDIVALSFAISGNQRAGAADNWGVQFDVASPTALLDWGYVYGGSTVHLGPHGPLTWANLTQQGLAADAPFTDITFFIQPDANGSLTFKFWTDGGDNIGPILDNVSLDISAVPEPASWALMIGGFAIAGAAMRRRGAAVRFA